MTRPTPLWSFSTPIVSFFTFTSLINLKFIFKNFLNIFIYLFLAALGLHCCVRAFSSCGERGLLFVAVCRLLIAVASLVSEHRLQACGLQQLWLAGCRAQAQQLWHMGLVVPWHVGSSRTRAQTCVPCTGRQILNHCATREVLKLILIEVIRRTSALFLFPKSNQWS